MTPFVRRFTGAAALTALAAVATSGCASAQQQPAATAVSATAPTADEARAFVEKAEREIDALSILASRAQWIAANFITEDSEALSAEHTTNYSIAIQRNAMEAKRFDGLQLDPTLRRKLTLLKLALAAPPPGNTAEAEALTRLTTSMEADYGKGSYCTPRASTLAAAGRAAAASGAGAQPAGSTADSAGGAGASAQRERLQMDSGSSNGASRSNCLQISDLSQVIAENRDPATLLDAWKGWHAVGAPMRERYSRFVDLSNKGARELGFADLGTMWRSNYDMPADAFSAEVERLWQQVRPLYLSLHAYVRTKLGEKYGTELVPQNGMIPAHLLGNMWAQEWGNIYDVVAPATSMGPGYDLTALLKQKGIEPVQMVKIGEQFFTSMGFAPLPQTFWERSLITKPRDREVVCHASAWSIDNRNDVRIKMCTQQTAEDFVTVHHELGHNFYQRAYNGQPNLFQQGANDGFHEAIGDAVALSITPQYLKTIGLLEQVPSAAADTMLLLREALDKIAFLPFGLLVDQWRWKVFSGDVTPANYNAAWWELRNRYQGVSAPLPRSEADFDAGAKYHVPANTPYTRYFLARVLQFQFYRALCRESGHAGPLNRCSFYGSKEAGAKLNAMLEMGASRPWPEVLKAATGEDRMDANAMMEYFAPLKAWLDKQNAGKQVGW